MTAAAANGTAVHHRSSAEQARVRLAFDSRRVCRPVEPLWGAPFSSDVYGVSCLTEAPTLSARAWERRAGCGAAKTTPSCQTTTAGRVSTDVGGADDPGFRWRKEAETRDPSWGAAASRLAEGVDKGTRALAPDHHFSRASRRRRELLLRTVVVDGCLVTVAGRLQVQVHISSPLRVGTRQWKVYSDDCIVPFSVTG